MREDANADAIIVNDVQITPTSSIAILRAAARFLGTSTSGSKSKIYEKIRSSRVASLQLRAFEIV